MAETTHHPSVHCPHFQTPWNSGVMDLESAVATPFELYKIPSSTHNPTAPDSSPSWHLLEIQQYAPYASASPSSTAMISNYFPCGRNLPCSLDLGNSSLNLFSLFSTMPSNITLPPHLLHISLSCTFCLTISHTDWLLYFTLSLHNNIHFHYTYLYPLFLYLLQQLHHVQESCNCLIPWSKVPKLIIHIPLFLFQNHEIHV